MTRTFKITLLRGNPPPAGVQPDINRDLRWFCTSLGLVGNRDKNLSQFRIFIVLLKARQHNKQLSSDMLAQETDLTRATVIHHLSKLAASGIVLEEHERYRLIVNSMEELVSHLRKELDQGMQDLESISKRIDSELGLRQ